MADAPETSSADEYEYEYDETETETFFVDIDLSSLNAETKPSHSAVPSSMTPAKRKADGTTSQSYATRVQPSPDPAPTPAKATRATPMQERRDTSPRIAENDQDALLPHSSRVQILDLGSVNPIISYQGQVYSGTWSDMVGTNMFFTDPETMDASEILESTDDYDLIGISRIKLVGHRARLTQKPPVAAQSGAESDNAPPVEAEGNLEAPDPADRARQRQASFLESIKAIRRSRKAAEAARTGLDDGITPSIQDLEHVSRSKIDHGLNEQDIGDDGGALARLPKIYSQAAEGESDPTESLKEVEKRQDEADMTM